MDDNPSVISHVSIGTNDLSRATAFYDAVLLPLGYQRIMEHPGAVGYGKAFPEFWVQTPLDQNPATVGNGTHIGLLAADTAQVDAFYRAAMAAGATSEGEPGARAEYGEPYYGCFIRDLDGHKVEIMVWDPSRTRSG